MNGSLIAVESLFRYMYPISERNAPPGHGGWPIRIIRLYRKPDLTIVGSMFYRLLTVVGSMFYRLLTIVGSMFYRLLTIVGSMFYRLLTVVGSMFYRLLTVVGSMFYRLDRSG